MSFSRSGYALVESGWPKCSIINCRLCGEHCMDPLSDACLSLNVKDMESGQVQFGGHWVVRMPAHNGVLFGASLKGAYWLLIGGSDHPILIKEGDCYLVANHHGYCV